jgi:hypothetical protein
VAASQAFVSNRRHIHRVCSKPTQQELSDVTGSNKKLRRGRAACSEHQHSPDLPTVPRLHHRRAPFVVNLVPRLLGSRWAFAKVRAPCGLRLLTITTCSLKRTSFQPAIPPPSITTPQALPPTTLPCAETIRNSTSLLVRRKSSPQGICSSFFTKGQRHTLRPRDTKAGTLTRSSAPSTSHSRRLARCAEGQALLLRGFFVAATYTFTSRGEKQHRTLDPNLQHHILTSPAQSLDCDGGATYRLRCFAQPADRRRPSNTHAAVPA